MSHISEGSFAGSVIAALFLKRFVRNAKRFAHLDIFGWVPAEQPGRPKGGEPQGARALFHFFAESLKDRDRRRPARSAPPCLSATTSRPKSRCAGVSRRGFVKGEQRQVVAPSLALRREPLFDATLDTEALRGEVVTVYDESEGLGLGAAFPRRLCRLRAGRRPHAGAGCADAPDQRAPHLRLPRARRQDAAACAAQSQCGHRRAAQGEVPRPRRRRLCRCEPRGAGWPNPISSPWPRRSSARPIFGAAAPRSGPTVRGSCSSRSRPPAALPPRCRHAGAELGRVIDPRARFAAATSSSGNVGIMTSGKTCSTPMRSTWRSRPSRSRKRSGGSRQRVTR